MSVVPAGCWVCPECADPGQGIGALYAHMHRHADWIEVPAVGMPTRWIPRHGHGSYNLAVPQPYAYGREEAEERYRELRDKDLQDREPPYPAIGFAGAGKDILIEGVPYLRPAPPMPTGRVDWARVAELELEFWGQTFDHDRDYEASLERPAETIPRARDVAGVVVAIALMVAGFAAGASALSFLDGRIGLSEFGYLFGAFSFSTAVLAGVRAMNRRRS